MEPQRADEYSAVPATGEAQRTCRTSVGDLVKQINSVPAHDTDGRDKRGRSESGDALPAGKRSDYRRGELGRSPGQYTESVKEKVEVMLQDFETKFLGNISRDLHELREGIQTQLDSFETRIKDLENHVEERDNEVEGLRKELDDVRREILTYRGRAEDAEINSRLPCLILSGGALAPRREGGRPGYASGLPGAGPGSAPAMTSPTFGDGGARRAAGNGPRGSADQRTETAGAAGPAGGESADRPVTAAGSAPGPGAGAGRRRDDGGDGGRGGQREDINQLVVSTLNRCLPGLNMSDEDIDRAHRLPGAGNRVMVRFVRSGRDSVRDQVYWRRLSLRGRDLFIAESLTKLRGLIFRSLLSAKKQGKIHTVYSRGGQVFFKWREFGAPEKVDSLDKMGQLGLPVVQ